MSSGEVGDWQSAQYQRWALLYNVPDIANRCASICALAACVYSAATKPNRQTHKGSRVAPTIRSEFMLVYLMFVNLPKLAQIPQLTSGKYWPAFCGN